jgi:hypothetical protein
MTAWSVSSTCSSSESSVGARADCATAALVLDLDAAAAFFLVAFVI